ncbi:MAG: regulatory protein TetR [Firmicutes bacterium]|nr:regulatory protein TetR [Bacillota bacterium]
MEQLFVHDGKKGAILKTSLELFASKGYNAVSVRDIAKAAGVSEAALYKHFKGKEDMALYIFSAIISEYTRQLEQVDSMDDEAVNKLCHIVAVTYDLYRQYPNEIRFALLSQYFLWDMVAEEIKPHFLIRKIINEGMDHGNIPRQEVYLWISIYTGIMLQPLAQYPYFYDVLPEFDILKTKVIFLVRKLFG